MYRKNFWCKFVIMDDSFTYCLENIERQQCLDRIMRQYMHRFVCRALAKYTGYKYVDNRFLFVCFFLDNVNKTKSMDVKCQ